MDKAKEKKRELRSIQEEIRNLRLEEERVRNEIKIIENNDPRQLKIPFNYD